MSDSQRDEIRLVVLTTSRQSFRGIMEHMRGTYGLTLADVVTDLQLSAVFHYEREKQRVSPAEAKRLEHQEVAVLDLIVSVGREMAYSQ